MKTLILCRHAKSSWKYDTDDMYRPLNTRGIAQAPLMANNLANTRSHHLDLPPDLVLCSPAVRAWSTAVCYFQLCGWDYNCLKINPDLHEASGNSLLQELRKTDDSVNSLALFGHNPGMNAIIDILDNSRQLHPNLVTSGRVILELDVQRWQDIAQSCGSIVNWTIPADL